jgi:hypothetical protein
MYSSLSCNARGRFKSLINIDLREIGIRSTSWVALGAPGWRFPGLSHEGNQAAGKMAVISTYTDFGRPRMGRRVKNEK